MKGNLKMKAINFSNRSTLKQMIILSFMLLFLFSAVSFSEENGSKNPSNINTTEAAVLTSSELSSSEMLTIESNMIFSFSIQKGDYVRFSIFDQKGAEIKVLVDEIQSAGEFSADLSQADLKKGTYYYRLVVGKHKEVRKLNILY
ncbi:MAG TPA: hypothetical protein DCX92_08690 [Bacteroidetes bacterium]|nr:hypothetical protein [Bacteroidota bacterium]